MFWIQLNAQIFIGLWQIWKFAACLISATICEELHFPQHSSKFFSLFVHLSIDKYTKQKKNDWE